MDSRTTRYSNPGMGRKRPTSGKPSPRKVLVSACLTGVPCRWDGGRLSIAGLAARIEAEGVEVVPFCPEEAGGLGTPRPRAWLVGGTGEDVLDGRARVVDEHGKDVTEAFLAGARAALERCLACGATEAVLAEGSPSCGPEETHVGTAGSDGSRRVAGSGVTAALLRRHGIRLCGA